MTDQPTAPNQRTFTLNSPEAYEALCPRDDEHCRHAGVHAETRNPWILNGALPREPRVWNRPVVVEASTQLLPGTGRGTAQRS